MLWGKFACPLLSLATLLAAGGCNVVEQRRSTDSSDSDVGGGPGDTSRKVSRIQHGQCTYTFILPENDAGVVCQDGQAGGQYNTNALQRDAPLLEQDFSSQKIQHLEHVMENYTQWLQKVGESCWNAILAINGRKVPEASRLFHTENESAYLCLGFQFLLLEA